MRLKAIEAAEVGAPTRSLWQRLITLGPGLITGAADDDPSGISTYSVAGASAGLSMLWLALFTTPMMAVVQGMCARIGMVTGRGLAANIRSSVSLWAAYAIAVMVIAANTFNVGADFAGMAASAHMVAPVLPTPVWNVLFGAVLIVGLIYLSYRRIASFLKYLTLTLCAYIVTAFIVHPRWSEVFTHLVVPQVQLTKGWITTAMGVLGTTITPYLFFWQSALEVEEEKAQGRTTLKERRGATDEEIRDAHFDVNVGMVFSNLVMFFIITTTALTLFAHGKTNIQTAQDAARALEPLAGHLAALLFTLGMVGTGLLAIPALAGSSAYIAAEMLSFRRQGLNEQPKRAPQFYAVLAAGLLVGIALPFTRLDPIRALYWSAVLNGIVSVPLIFLVIRIANTANVMGKWRNSILANAWAWVTFALMFVAAFALFTV
ncbi:MAG TPA: Nramp family divalent metal transporter [Candidatus Baltobacteraceae bacterium]|nr:Nramp family divalent metal transporter [Candidatus Baltobacteraceae bacterium]